MTRVAAPRAKVDAPESAAAVDPAVADHAPAPVAGKPAAAGGAAAGGPAAGPAAADPAPILQHAVGEAVRLLDADGGLIGLLDAEGRLRFAFESGITGPRVERWRTTLETAGNETSGLIATAIASRKVHATADYGTDRSFRHSRRGDKIVAEMGIRSLVAAPLLDGERSLGALAIYSPRPSAFDDADVALIKALADHAAAAIANAELVGRLRRSQDEVARRAAAQESLARVAAQLTALRDPTDVLHQAVDAAAALLGADGVSLDLIDHATSSIRWAYDAGIEDEALRTQVRNLEQPLGLGMVGMAIDAGHLVVTDDYLRDDRFVHMPAADDFIRSGGLRTMVAAPLLGEAGPVGVLDIYSRREAAFGPPELAIIETFAGQAAIALTNARLIQELGRSQAELERRADAERSLRQIAARLTALRDPADVLQHAVDEAARLLEADAALLDLIDPSSGLIRWAYDAGIRDDAQRDLLRGLEIRIGQGMFGRAVGEGNEIVTGDYLADDRFVHSPAIDDFARQAGIASMIAAPLVGESGPLGVLGIFTARRDAYGDEEVALSKSLATQATIALTNARLIDELKGSRADVERRADAERTLREIGTGISALRESNEVVRRTVDEAVRLLDADGAEFDLVDAETGLLQGVYMSGGQLSDDEWPGEQHGTADVGVSGVALRTGSAFRTGDYMGDERFTHAEGPDQYASVKGIRSVISAPLVGEHGPFGTVTVWSTRPEAFSERDEALLLALVTQAAIALTNARLIAALEASKASIARRADAERALREISVRITAIHDPASVLQRVVDEACRLVGADGARIDLLDETSGEIRWAYSTKGLAASDETRFTKPLLPGEGVAGRVLLENRPIMTGDYLADPEIVKTPAARKSAHETGIRSILAVPLPGEHGAFGALSVLATAPDAFDDDDVAVIEALAPQAAIAVANARLIDELARSKQELAGRVDTEQALREIAARITAIRDPDEVLQLIVDEARRLLGSDGAHLTFMAEERTHLVPVVASGVDDATRRWMLDLEFPLDGGINGLAASLGRPIRTDDYLVDPRVPHEPDDQYVAARLGIRGCAVAPLRAPAGEIIGTLAVSFRTPREVDDESVARLQVLADQAAIAVTNARLDKLLSDSESRYRHLVENSPDLVWSVDADGRFTFLSETCERLTGWAVEELIGGHFGGIVHPSSQEVAEIDWTAGLGEGSSEIRGHVNLLHRDGHPIPAEFVAVSRIEGGVFVGANGSVRDMSERDRLERELQASEERYRFLVENSPDIVFSIDADGLFTYVSETIEQITGWLPAQATGRHFGFLIAEHSQPTALERWETLRQDPTSLQVVELDLVRPDGSFVPVEVSAIGIAARDGRFAGIHGSTRDISERRRLERDLRESEERYRYLVRASPDVVWAVDDQGVLTFMGDRVTELTGWTPDELVGKRFDFLTMPEYLAQSEEIWEGVRRDPGSVFPLRILMPRKSGDPIPVEVWITGSVHDGAFVGAHGSIRDMRENERLEGDLRRQAAELAAGDARAHLARELHDSVTQALFSMTLMTRSVEMLLSRDPEAAAQRLTTLRELQRDALAEMRALIFELRPGGLEEGGLVPALRRHAAAVQGRIGLPVVVEAEVDARLPADVEDVLYRIAQEALHNVVKHARARTVRLTLSIHDDTVRLAVVDDGAGFDPAQVPAGHLGLAGMKARAETIGAELAVRTRPGRGTTIEVTVTSPTAVPAVVAED